MLGAGNFWLDVSNKKLRLGLERTLICAQTVKSSCKQIYWADHLFLHTNLYKFIGTMYSSKYKMKRVF